MSHAKAAAKPTEHFITETCQQLQPTTVIPELLSEQKTRLAYLVTQPAGRAAATPATNRLEVNHCKP